MATAMPPSDMMFTFTPCLDMMMKAIRMPSGSVMMATMPLLTWNRKAMQTRPTIRSCWPRLTPKLVTARSINAVRS